MNLVEEAKKQISDIINTACEKARHTPPLESNPPDSGEPPKGNTPPANDTPPPANDPPPPDRKPLPAGDPLRGSVEIPRDTSHGDYAATHAMAAAKQMRLPSRAIAETLAAHIDLEGTDFESVSVAGAGFLNFTVSKKWYGKVMQTVLNENAEYGAVNIGDGKKVMVEFVSANPTGPITVGNARGAVFGDTLAAVLEKAGYDVWREFYLNDTGNQVELFGKSIEARYLQLCPNAEAVEFPEDGYHCDDIKELAQKMYNSDGGALQELSEEKRREKLTQFGLSHNIEVMKTHLERYKIRFNEWFSEKKMHESGYIAETVEALDKAGLLYEKDGAIWLRNTDLGGDKDEVLRKSNGFFTYYTADIAYHRNKLERGFDKVVDIWGADHHGHAKRLMATMTSPQLGQALGVDGNKLRFLLMQMIRIMRDGEVMKVSKRTGKALTLNDLLDEINVDACRFFNNARADSQLEFDIDLAVRQDSENPVYYVQYAHARICSLIRALAAEGFEVPQPKQINTYLLRHETEQELIRQLSLLPEEITLAARDLEPSRINRYVTEVASRFHKFYTACRIKGEENELLEARLALAEATRIVIRNCLEVLNITAPEKM